MSPSVKKVEPRVLRERSSFAVATLEVRNFFTDMVEAGLEVEKKERWNEERRLRTKWKKEVLKEMICLPEYEVTHNRSPLAATALEEILKEVIKRKKRKKAGEETAEKDILEERIYL